MWPPSGGRVHSRGVMGWVIYRVHDACLVERAVRLAHTLRADVAVRLACHANHCAQCTSEQVWEACRNLGVAHSVGRTGVCFESAMASRSGLRCKLKFNDRQR